MAQQAVGALLDKGIQERYLSLITREQDSRRREDDEDPGAAEKSAEKGITTTTGADAASGAAKGAGIGLGVGALAALASLVVPGFWLVIVAYKTFSAYYAIVGVCYDKQRSSS